MESNLCAYSQLNAENLRHEFTRVNVIAVHKEAKVIYLGMLHAVGCLLNLRKSFPLSKSLVGSLRVRRTFGQGSSVTSGVFCVALHHL